MARLSVIGVASLCMTAAACESGSIDLVVDLKTDLRAGVEIFAIRTELTGPGGSAPREVTHEALASADFVRGQRIAEYGNVAAGAQLVRVTLLDADGNSVATRSTSLTIADDYALTVLVTRDCGALVCPIPGGDPALVECVGSRCVAPGCNPAAPELCGDRECTEDLDCASAVSCVRSRCVDGECFDVPDDGLCAAAERCDAMLGCVDPSTPDGGIEMDASVPDAGPPDAGPACSGTTCDDGDPCTHGDTCAAGVCAGTRITCASTTCVTRACNGTATCTSTNLRNGTVCGASYERCCSGRCANLRTDEANCGGCGLTCEGRTCGVMPGTTYPACRCVGTTQCRTNGADWTCWNRDTDATFYCNCQSNPDCAPGQTCAIVTGHNYCRY